MKSKAEQAKADLEAWQATRKLAHEGFDCAVCGEGPCRYRTKRQGKYRRVHAGSCVVPKRERAGVKTVLLFV